MQVNDPAQTDTEYFGRYADKTDRCRFVRYVMLIMGLGLLCSTLQIAQVMYHNVVREWYREHATIVLFISCCIIFLGYPVFICVPGVRRQQPFNLLFFLILVEARATLLISITMDLDTKVMLIFFAGICFLSFIMSFIALTTGIDFTRMSGYALVTGLSFFIFFILLLVVSNFCSEFILPVFYSFFFVLIFCMYFVCTLQLIFADATYDIGSGQYLGGAIVLHMEIIFIFVYLLDAIHYCTQKSQKQ